jgi:hypothetical protein
MPQLNIRNNNKNKNNQNNLNNANSRNQQSTIINAQVAGNSNSMDDNTHMDDNSNDRWTVVIDLKKNDGKRNYSSSEQNSPKTPINRNKKIFYTINRYEILSQIDLIYPVQSSSKF